MWLRGTVGHTILTTGGHRIQVTKLPVFPGKCNDWSRRTKGGYNWVIQRYGLSFLGDTQRDGPRPLVSSICKDGLVPVCLEV